jgi:hypothetical protein
LMDILLCRYDMPSLMMLEPLDVLALADFAMEKREEDRAFMLYAGIYPHMDKKTFKPFSEFFKRQTKVEVSERSAEDILAEVARIRQAQKG